MKIVSFSIELPSTSLLQIPLVGNLFLRMIFSVQNNNLTTSVEEFLSEMVTMKELKSLSGIFVVQKDVPIQVWHMIAIMRRDFSEHHQMQVPINENKLATLRMMSQNAEKFGMDYPEFPHCSYVAQTAKNFLFLSEEEGSAENAITIGEDEGFSETWTPVIKPPRQPL